MGAALSAVIDNIYMEHLEETAPLQPTLWLRYIYNICLLSIMLHGQYELEHFHGYINEQHTIHCKTRGRKTTFSQCTSRAQKDCPHVYNVCTAQGSMHTTHIQHRELD